MPLDFTDEKSKFVQVMAWCRQQQAITRANVYPDLCHQKASLGLNELNECVHVIKYERMWTHQNMITYTMQIWTWNW